MRLDSATLRKILALEREKGYRDVAVVGGLDRYLERQAGELPDRFAATNYATLDAAQREEWVNDILRWLDGEGASGVADIRLKDKIAAKPVSDTASGTKNAVPGTKNAASSAKSAASKAKRAAIEKKPASTAVADDEIIGKLDVPITAARGIRDKQVPKFRRLGVETVRDLLYFFPRRHLDYSKRKTIAQLKVGEEQTVIATVWQAKEAFIGGRRSTEAGVGDESGNMRVVWFNQPYLARQFRPDTKLVLSGKVSMYKGVKVFQSPEYEPFAGEDLTHTGRLIPLYALTAGLSPRVVRRLVKETVDLWTPRLPDFLPGEVRQRARLLGLSEAINQAHYPQSEQLKDRARQRLAFDELFLMQLEVLSRRRDWREGIEAKKISPAEDILQRFIASLPYSLTQGQRRALDEILADIAGTRPMTRLLQGEVGSGKTIVATAALLATAAGGLQGAFMAPTEILAEQHYFNISALLAEAGSEDESEGDIRTFTSLLPRPLTIALLVGSMKASRKKSVHRAIAAGEVDIVVGTHAIIQGGVEFDRLGLAIVDEQHRFGVMQRSALRQKGANPHLLVMTATPIPRSLALTLYGDLDLSVIDELPPGRQVIKTRWLGPEDRDKAYRFLAKEIGEGRQAFIICPLIAESESIEAKAAVVEHERLSSEVFPGLRLGLVHGRLKPSDKEQAMRSFRGGEYDILVATPVVEVGIDVPNATVMLIEGADRFGLAQLHQFRGRVGRGEHQSYCILLAESPSPEAVERLSILEHNQDGFALAEEDLKLRGPGEFFGIRQSGLPDLRMARLSDVKLLELARNEAIRLFKEDPELSQPEHRLLKKELDRLWGEGTTMEGS
jgi:ATP-dependent DNA helicase RecG